MNNAVIKNQIYTKPNYWLQLLSNAILIIFVTISLFLLSFSFIYKSTTVVGISMQPTLNPKGEFKSDTVYINKFAPYTNGDIVVIKQPNSSVEYIIKRVIGMPNDKILITENALLGIELYVNNTLLLEPYLLDYPDNNSMYVTYSKFETLKTTHPHLFNNSGELVVPSGEIFALGDNRAESSDSSNKGTFKMDKVEGRVDFVIPYGTSPQLFFLNKFTPFNFSKS